LQNFEKEVILFSKVNSKQSLVYVISGFDYQKFSLKSFFICSLNQTMVIWVHKAVIKQLVNAVTPVMDNTQ